MSILSNTKAQINSVYSGVKSTPLAKGIKGILYEENLMKNTQKRILNDINKTASNQVKATSQILKSQAEEMSKMFGLDAGNLSDIAEKNFEKISSAGIDSIDDKDLKKLLGSRFKNDPKGLNLQNEAIINRAKSNSVERTSSLINNEQAKSFIVDAAREVDGQVTFMTPIHMAKEYYGKPMANALSDVRNSDYKGALKNVGVAGARVGATTGAIVGTGLAVGGVSNAVTSAYNSIVGNSYERGGK